MAVVEFVHATEFDTQTRYLCTPDKRFVPCEGQLHNTIRNHNHEKESRHHY